MAHYSCFWWNAFFNILYCFELHTNREGRELTLLLQAEKVEEENTEPNAEEEPKKRGRKPKAKAEVAEKEGEAPKRGRGRPAKSDGEKVEKSEKVERAPKKVKKAAVSLSVITTHSNLIRGGFPWSMTIQFARFNL